jgi:hypothetical protein
MPEKIKREYVRNKRSGYSPRRFSAVMGTAATLATVSLITFFSIGMVGAAMGVGIGGFVANFGKVNATEGAEVFPVVGQQPACDDAPQLQATLNGTAKLSDGVEFFKDMPLPSGAFPNDDFARITIVGQDNGTPIQVSGLSLRLSALETDRLGLGGAEIVEYGPEDYDSGNGTPGAEGSYVDTTDNATGGIQTEGPSAAFDDGRSALDTDTGPSSTPEFGIDATSFLIKNGSAAAHFVSFGGISLNDVNIAVQILNESESAARVVRPNERTCDALAEASTVNDSDNLSESSGGIEL